MNQILVIRPYWDSGTWVFDDEQVGLVREPFVMGIPEMIDILVADIPNAREGFRLLFSPDPFPGYRFVARRIRQEYEGWWYATDDPAMEGWLCPALFKYFEEAPEHLYVKAEEIKE